MDRDFTTEQIMDLFKAKIISRNEVRILLGIDDIDNDIDYLTFEEWIALLKERKLLIIMFIRHLRKFRIYFR